jgi:hypothetical protein
MQGNSDNSELASALTIATNANKPNGYELLHTNANKPNGYELLHITLHKLVPGFDERKVNIKTSLCGSYESIFRYAAAIEQTSMLPAKRGQRCSPKSAAIQFLDGIITEAGHAYIIQARILRTDLNALTNYGPVPPRFSLKQMAFEIQESIPNERADPDLERKASIYKSIATMTIDDRPTNPDQTGPTVSFSPSVSQLESKNTVQESIEPLTAHNLIATVLPVTQSRIPQRISQRSDNPYTIHQLRVMHVASVGILQLVATN